MKMLVFALLALAVAACAPNGGPRPSSHNFIEPPAAPALGPRPAAPPVGFGPTVMPSRMAAPPRAPRCHIEKKHTVAKDGRKQVTKYRVCR